MLISGLQGGGGESAARRERREGEERHQRQEQEQEQEGGVPRPLRRHPPTPHQRTEGVDPGPVRRLCADAGRRRSGPHQVRERKGGDNAGAGNGKQSPAAAAGICCCYGDAGGA